MSSFVPNREVADFVKLNRLIIVLARLGAWVNNGAKVNRGVVFTVPSKDKLISAFFTSVKGEGDVLLIPNTSTVS